MSGAPPNRDELVSQFIGFTEANADVAVELLTAADWNVETAVSLYFDGPGHDEDEAADDDDELDEEEAPAAPSGGGRRLGDGSGAGAASGTGGSAAGSSSRSQPRSGLRTLKDLQGDGAGQSHAHDDDSDEDQDFFAGGEKSGLAVHNPGNQRDQVQGLFDHARRNMPRPGGDDDDPASSHFAGRGHVLGDEETPSTVVEEPQAEVARPAPRVRRLFYVWQDGFSVDDGPLYRLDDPANADTLNHIMNGRAPLHILDVEPGQEVDVELVDKRGQAYVKPQAAYKPFGGAGRRLGSPVPGESSASATTTTASAQVTAAASSATSGSTADPSVPVDDSQPVVRFQIRLLSGTRLPARFNASHTIDDVYSFVDHSTPGAAQQQYVLRANMPPKVYDDRKAVLGDLPDIKNAVLFQHKV